jgi:hypothetical protein
MKTTSEFGIEVPEHTLLSRLRGGGMASVFLAREERLGRLVALKVIDDRLSGDEQFRRRFEREARTAAALVHPNIVPIFQYGFTADARPYLSMPFLEDGSLRDRLRKRGALPVDEALSIARQIASALLAAHARNVVHRDLKPDNVLFQGDTALLSDFGIAKVLDSNSELTSAGMNPGTVRYFSPEQAADRTVDARTDIYALGVLLYEMLTGRVPIDGDSAVQLMLRIATEAPAPLPPPLQALQPVIDVLLAKDPAARLGSCAEVITVLQAMEHNWTRYGEVSLLTQGVVLTPWGGVRSAPGCSASEAPTLLFQGEVRLQGVGGAAQVGGTRAPAPVPANDAPPASVSGDKSAAVAGAPSPVAAGIAAAACILVALLLFVRLQAGTNPADVDVAAPVVAPAEAPASAVTAARAPTARDTDDATTPVDERGGVAVISRARGSEADGRAAADAPRYVPAADHDR